MKKSTILYSFSLAATMLLTNCSEDKGNYDYTPIDDIAIEFSDFSRNVVSGGSLKITPKLTHSLEEKKGELSYQWEIDGNIVSTDMNLDITLPPMSYGEKVCALTVTDKTTGIKFIQTFEIEVVGAISVGYYFLTEDESHNTILSFLPVTTPENPEPAIVHTRSCGDVGFAPNPISIYGLFSSNDLAGSGVWSIALLSKGEGNRCIITDGQTFLPSTIVSASNFADQVSGYTFNPELCVGDMPGNLWFVSDGKIISYSSGLLYRPAKHTGEYRWNYPIPSYEGWPFFYVYDELSYKYYAVRSTPDNPELGISGDSNAYDDVVEIKNSPDLSTHSMIGGYSLSFKACMFCTATSEGIHVHSLSNDQLNSFSYEGESLLPVSGADAETKALVVKEHDWFFFIGNKIYTSPVDLPKLADFLTIPEEYGKVTSVAVSGKQTRLIVTTYDENSSEELKGSVLLINIDTKEIKAYKHSIHKCVSALGANDATNEYFDIGGDGL